MNNPFTHALNEDVACVVGADAALIFRRVAFWIEGEEQNLGTTWNGRSFTRISTKGLSGKFPWLTQKQVRSALKKLCENGYLERAETEDGKPLRLGANKSDPSGWYGLARPEEPPNIEGAQTGSPDAQTGSPNAQTGSPNAQTGSSIRNNTPSNEPTNTLTNDGPSSSMDEETEVEGERLGFGVFIAAYPSGTGGREGAARAVWEKLSLSDQEKAYAAAQRLPKTHGTYPAVWLKERGWLTVDAPASPAYDAPPRPDCPAMGRIYDWFAEADRLPSWSIWLTPDHIRLEGDTIIPANAMVARQITNYANFRDPLRNLGFAIGDVARDDALPATLSEAA